MVETSRRYEDELIDSPNTSRYTEEEIAEIEASMYEAMEEEVVYSPTNDLKVTEFISYKKGKRRKRKEPVMITLISYYGVTFAYNPRMGKIDEIADELYGADTPKRDREKKLRKMFKLK